MNSHVNDLIDVNTGNDEEDSWPPGSSCQDPSQAEYDSLLILLDNLDDKTQGEGQRDKDKDDRANDEKLSTYTWSLVTCI